MKKSNKSNFANFLSDTEKNLEEYNMAEHSLLYYSDKLHELYKKGKGNGKQRKLAKELLEEAGLL